MVDVGCDTGRVVEEAAIPVEPGATVEPGSSGQAASSRRVVRQPNRGSRLVALVVVAGLVAGGLLVLFRDGGGYVDPEERRQAEAARDAYSEAVMGLGRARTFAYRGSVHAAEPGPMRPGSWLAGDVTVEGAVLLPQSITREVAVDASGAAVETVSSGPTAWGRGASSAAGLAGAPWAVVRSPDATPLTAYDAPDRSRLGIALLADLLRSARDRRNGPPDATGRRTLRATVPTDTRHARYGDLLAGADVSLVLDDAGDIAHVVVTAAPAGDPELVLDLAIERLGEPDLITPADVGDPARRTVPVDVLAAGGVDPLELGSVPSGWALTGAGASRTGSMGRCGAAGCIGTPEGCASLRLDYRALAEVTDGWLSLTVASESCLKLKIGEPTGGEPFRAGTYVGRTETVWLTRGTMSDGVTWVSFDTDLSTADAAVVLASLTPFDVATDPTPIAGIPSP